MKKILPFLFSLFLISAFAQDSVDAMVVPRETSFENYNLLVEAAAAIDHVVHHFKVPEFHNGKGGMRAVKKIF